MNAKECFERIFTDQIKRPGSEKLLDWLETGVDFFTACNPPVAGQQSGL